LQGEQKNGLRNQEFNISLLGVGLIDPKKQTYLNKGSHKGLWGTGRSHRNAGN
jgi:hypothetical protein